MEESKQLLLSHPALLVSDKCTIETTALICDLQNKVDKMYESVSKILGKQIVQTETYQAPLLDTTNNQYIPIADAALIQTCQRALDVAEKTAVFAVHITNMQRFIDQYVAENS